MNMPLKKRPAAMFFLLETFFFSANLFAVKAKPTPTVVLQPDGSALTVLGYGDEFYHFAENEEGYSLVMNDQGWWVYAKLGLDGAYVPSSVVAKFPGRRTDGEARFLAGIPKHLRENAKYRLQKSIPPLQKRSPFSTGALPAAVMESRIVQTPLRIDRLTSSTLRALVLLVQFSDLPSLHPVQSFQSLFNDDSWESGSVNTYFKANTDGTVQISADCRGWMTADHPLSNYADRNPSHGLHVRELVRAAVDQAEKDGVDFSKYDNDGDGSVDALFVVHAGTGAEEGVRTQYIWSHASSLSWDNLDVKYDGVTINDYTIEPELEGGRHSGIGVFCHEFGHQLGLPDLYDTNYGEDGESSGLGLWDLMAAGSWGADGKNVNRPSNLSAWSKELLGLVDPVTVLNTRSLSFQSDTPHSVYKVWLDPCRDSEYLLIENRQKTGFDQDLLGSGLFIYRVDRHLSEIYPFSNSINATSSHLGVQLLQADGLNQLNLNYNDGDAGDPFPGTTGNACISDSTHPDTRLWDGNRSNVSISEIDPSSKTMTANAIANGPLGQSQQFYKTVHGLLGWPTLIVAYALVRFTPDSDGQLTSVEVLSNDSYSDVQVRAYKNFSSGYPSVLLASSSLVNPAVTMFYDVRFTPGVDVTKGVPVYVELRYTRKEAYYQIPIDFYTQGSGNCFISAYGNTYTLVDYEIAARAVFSFSDVAAPVLVFPMNGEKDKPVQIGFRWNAAPNADAYRLQIAKDSLFQTPVYDQSGITTVSQEVTGLIPNTQYHWRVMANNGGKSGPWSAGSTFRTAVSSGSPAKAVLYQPPSGSTACLVTTTLSWKASEGALRYRLCIASDASFRAVVFDDSTLTGTSAQPRLHSSMTYFWKVHALNAAGQGPWSDVWNFRTVEMDSSRWTVYNTSNTTLPQNNVDPILIDRNHYTWIGSGYSGFGFVRFDGQSWKVFNASNSGLPSDTVWTFASGSDGSLWIGTHNGLSNLNMDVWRHFNASNSALPYNDVRALAVDARGSLWVGTGFGGVAKYDGSVFIPYNTSAGLPSNEIVSVAVKNPDTVWVGTYKGLARFDGSRWSVFNKSNSSLPSDLVSSIAVDRFGKTWIGTSGGLCVVEGSAWTAYTPANSKMPEFGIHSIVFDSYDNAWIATRGGGLVKIRGSEWTVYNVFNSGFVTDALRHIAVDADGTKWITCDGGLAVFRQTAPVSPILSGPSNGGSDPSVDVTLSWKPSSETDTYGLQVSTASDFSTLVSDQTHLSDTLFVLQGLNAHTALFWRVRAENKGGVSAWSTVWQFTTGASTAVGQVSSTPDRFFLFQNYPNPFNPSTTLRFSVPNPCRVILKIFDVQGREVARLLDVEHSAGEGSVEFDAGDLPGGVYILRMEAAAYRATRKMLMLK